MAFGALPLDALIKQARYSALISEEAFNLIKTKNGAFPAILTSHATKLKRAVDEEIKIKFCEFNVLKFKISHTF